MKIYSQGILLFGTNARFFSRKKAREVTKSINTNDIYTGLLLPPHVWTLEHVVPQSRIMLPGKKNDLHNLAGLHTKINSSRGNKAFGDPKIFREYKGCKISKNLFSPIVGKGDVARKCAYMFEEYGDFIDIPSVISMETMMEWNYMFPPSDSEKANNEFIYDIQGTYNRFIDDSSDLQETLSFFTLKGT